MCYRRRGIPAGRVPKGVQPGRPRAGSSVEPCPEEPEAQAGSAVSCLEQGNPTESTGDSALLKVYVIIEKLKEAYL